MSAWVGNTGRLRLGKAEVVELLLAVAPILAHLDPALQVDLDAEQLLVVIAGGGADFFSASARPCR